MSLDEIEKIMKTTGPIMPLAEAMDLLAETFWPKVSFMHRVHPEGTVHFAGQSYRVPESYRHLAQVEVLVDRTSGSPQVFLCVEGESPVLAGDYTPSPGIPSSASTFRNQAGIAALPSNTRRSGSRKMRGSRRARSAASRHTTGNRKRGSSPRRTTGICGDKALLAHSGGSDPTSPVRDH